MKNQVSRRDFLKSGILASFAFYAQSELMGMNPLKLFNAKDQKDIYRFNVGNFKCICINDGGHYYLPEQFFKNVEKEQLDSILQKHNIPTDQIYTPYTHLIVDTGIHKVLMDMGAGKKLPNNGNLVKNMKSAGIEPFEIDSVFITHAHPDHIGGTLNDEGLPIYSNAQYYIWKDEWEFWFSENAFDKTSVFFVNVAREQLGPIKDRMIQLDKESEILAGIRVISAPGHTPGHMVVSFVSEGEKLYYIGDTVLHPLHLEHPDWLPIYDILPEKAAESKIKIFNLVSDENALVIGQHFTPFPSLGHIIKQDVGWKWIPII